MWGHLAELNEPAPGSDLPTARSCNQSYLVILAGRRSGEGGLLCLYSWPSFFIAPETLGEFDMNAQVQSKTSSLDAADFAAELKAHMAPSAGLSGNYQTVWKRMLDILLVLLMAPAALSVVALMCCLIALDGKSPFYRQARVGRGGKEFSMWKLRSMVLDADQLLQSYLDQDTEARAEWDRDQKLTNDPRITRIGRFIRQTSLDEVPQLWNVLKGEMSLVGPRPILPSQRSIYPGTEYYAMLPGITGVWQTSVRNESSFRDRATFDAVYYENLSFGTDLRLLVATVGVVLNATGR